MAEKLLEVNCERLDELLPDVEMVKNLNKAITEPRKLVDERTEQDLSDVETKGDFEVGFEGIPSKATPELEVSREEDYYLLREEGQLEILIEEIMPRECNQNNDGVWLTALLMSRIAKNQIFGEGNKRTAYLAGTLFLRNIQIFKGFTNPLIPDLDKKLTKMLSDVAIQNPDIKKPSKGRDIERDTEDLDKFLRSGLKNYL